MSERSKDELIDAQKQVIGILFEVIKRLQENNDRVLPSKSLKKTSKGILLTIQSCQDPNGS